MGLSEQQIAIIRHCKQFGSITDKEAKTELKIEFARYWISSLRYKGFHVMEAWVNDEKTHEVYRRYYILSISGD